MHETGAKRGREKEKEKQEEGERGRRENSAEDGEKLSMNNAARAALDSALDWPGDCRLDATVARQATKVAALSVF